MNIRSACLTTAITLLLAQPVVHAGERDHGRHHHGERHGQGRGHHHGHGHPHPIVVHADVIHVQPIIEVVHVAVPHRECSRTTTASFSSGHASATGMLLGGVIGGVIGHNVTRGHDRDAAILAGTLLGAVIGHDIGHNAHGATPVTHTHCHSVTDYVEEERIVGYRVKYRYRDHVQMTRTDRHPGARIRITITLD